MTLIHLIYVSSARQEMDGAGLDRILEASVRNNVSRGVTGMLCISTRASEWGDVLAVADRLLCWYRSASIRILGYLPF